MSSWLPFSFRRTTDMIGTAVVLTVYWQTESYTYRCFEHEAQEGFSHDQSSAFLYILIQGEPFSGLFASVYISVG